MTEYQLTYQLTSSDHIKTNIKIGSLIYLCQYFENYDNVLDILSHSLIPIEIEATIVNFKLHRKSRLYNCQSIEIMCQITQINAPEPYLFSTLISVYIPYNTNIHCLNGLNCIVNQILPYHKYLCILRNDLYKINQIIYDKSNKNQIK